VMKSHSSRWPNQSFKIRAKTEAVTTAIKIKSIIWD